MTIAVERLHPDEVSKALDAQGVAIRSGHHCAMPLHERYRLAASSLASFYFYNTSDEVGEFVTALRAALRLFRR